MDLHGDDGPRGALRRLPGLERADAEEPPLPGETRIVRPHREGGAHVVRGGADHGRVAAEAPEKLSRAQRRGVYEHDRPAGDGACVQRADDHSIEGTDVKTPRLGRDAGAILHQHVAGDEHRPRRWRGGPLPSADRGRRRNEHPSERDDQHDDARHGKRSHVVPLPQLRPRQGSTVQASLVHSTTAAPRRR